MDFGDAIAVDAAGNAYVAGNTSSLDFPTVNPIQPTHAGNFDAIVVKLDPTGSTLLYSTFFGGSGVEVSEGISVDAAGNIYVAGYTDSTDFPLANEFQSVYGGGINDGTILKLNPSGDTSLYSSYLGGNDRDQLFSLATDSGGNAYVTGFTRSTDFPVTPPDAYQTIKGEGEDVFITKIGDPFLPVDIDIKSGSFPNSINLGSNGNVPVAILSSDTFDATTVDPKTVTLASAPVKLKGKGKPMSSTSDVNEDGRLDLVVHVDTSAFELSETDQEAELEGQTSEGLQIRGVDSIRIVP